MKLSTRIITAVLLIAGSSGVVYAYSKHNDWGMSPEEKVEFVTERVTRKARSGQSTATELRRTCRNRSANHARRQNNESSKHCR